MVCAQYIVAIYSSLTIMSDQPTLRDALRVDYYKAVEKLAAIKIKQLTEGLWKVCETSTTYTQTFSNGEWKMVGSAVMAWARRENLTLDGTTQDDAFVEVEVSFL